MTARPPTLVRILGIDPGTVRLGYGVVDVAARGQLRYVECGVVAAAARRARPERLLEIGEGLDEILGELGPDEVALEEAFFGKNVQSTLALGEARGVALFVVGRRRLPVFGYAPARVKRVVAGHGRGGKTQVAFWVKALLGLRRTPAADAADALAIAICHARLRASVSKTTGEGGMP